MKTRWLGVGPWAGEQLIVSATRWQADTRWQHFTRNAADIHSLQGEFDPQEPHNCESLLQSLVAHITHCDWWGWQPQIEDFKRKLFGDLQEADRYSKLLRSKLVCWALLYETH